MQINSTELSGFLAFIPTTFCCAVASASGENRAVRRIWMILAGIYALLSVEIQLSSRHLIDEAIADWLRVQHLYPDRRPAQALVIILLFIFALTGALFAIRKMPTRSLRVAAAATATVLLLFLVEGVSLHAVDAIYYHPAGPIMLIGWLWLACGWVTATTAAHQSRTFNNDHQRTS